MSMEYIEFSEKTLDDAITTACQKLGVTSDRLEYEVIDHGSQGFLGFNARNAVIKARVKDEKTVGDVLKNSYSDRIIPEDESSEEDENDLREAEEEVSEAEEEESPEMKQEEHRRPRREGKPRHEKREQHGNRDFLETDAAAVPERREKKEEPKVVFTEEQIAEARRRAEEFLKNVFDAMDMDVEVTTDFDSEENILNISFEGEETAVLIGKRGQTLDSLQYLVSLVVNKGITGYIHVKADTENYRDRRRKTLENLARNIASKVKKTRRAVALEPMNPYERRIIHSALQNDRYVTTYSEGEDPFRKVIITPKRS